MRTILQDLAAVFRVSLAIEMAKRRQALGGWVALVMMISLKDLGAVGLGPVGLVLFRHRRLEGDQG